MAAPTEVSNTRSTNFAAMNATKDTPSVTWLTGDLIVVHGITGDNTRTLTAPVASGLSPNPAIVSGYPTNTASATKHYIWTTTAAAGGSAAFTGSIDSGVEGGYVVKVYRNHNGIGAILTPVHNTSGAPQTSFAGLSANSVVSAEVGHWNQATGARTYLTNAGAATEESFLDTGTFGTTMNWSHLDSGSAGAKTIGVSAPTGTNWWIVGIEIKGISVAQPITVNSGTEEWPKASSAPGSPSAGMVYYDTNDNVFKKYDGTTWW